MTRYFLHLRDGDGVIDDPEGKEFVDLEAAKAEADDAGREMMAEFVRTGQVIDGQVIEICDAAGTIWATLKLKDVVRLR